MVAIILASGMSKRLGENKLLVDFNGKPMVYWTIKAVKESKIDNVVLIYKDREVKRIGEAFNIKTIFNGKYMLGQSEGIKLGVTYNLDEDGFMFILGDQPFLTSRTLDEMKAIFEKEDKIIIPTYKGRRGAPNIFPRRFIENLLALEGDIGGRKIIKSNENEIIFYEIENELELEDIDSKETLDELRKRGGGNERDYSS